MKAMAGIYDALDAMTQFSVRTWHLTASVASLMRAHCRQWQGANLVVSDIRALAGGATAKALQLFDEKFLDLLVVAFRRDRYWLPTFSSTHIHTTAAHTFMPRIFLLLQSMST